MKKLQLETTTNELGLLQNVINDAEGKRKAITDFPTATLPGDYNVVDLEEFQSVRNQFRGKYNTCRIDDFKSYCDKMGHEHDICFVDSKNVSAKVVIDMGNESSPGHCVHSAKLTLNKTAAYSAVLGLTNLAFSQKKLFNFLQDWKSNITAVDSAGEEVAFTTAAQNVLSIDIEESVKSGFEETDFSAAKSSMARIEAKAQGDRVLPAGFIFTTKPYLPLSSRDFYLRLGIAKRHDSPVLTLRCEALEEIQENIVDEFDEKLTEKFGDRVIKGVFYS